jgi:hypothetical protein
MQVRGSWIFLLPLALVFGFEATGCGTPADSKGADPIHLNLVCPASDDGQSLTCDDSLRLAHFTPWANDALFRPGSTFTLWAAGPTRQASRLFFSACIPPRWKAPVWKTKAAFMAAARQGVSANQPGLSVPESCRPPGVHAPGMSHLAVYVSASTLQADVWHKLASGPAPTPLHTAIVCDLSDSTQGASCTPTSLLSAFDLWTEGSLLSPGSSLSVEMAGPLRDALRPVFSLSVPFTLPVGERVAYALGSRIELAQLFAGSVEKYGSTIAEAISTTVRRLRERRGRYQLVLLSDLMQISPGIWNFESALPLPNDFLSWLKKTNLAPDLRDVPVLVCGLHTGHFGTNSQTYATRLHDLWQRTFQSLGAPEVKLFSSCDAGFAT